MPINWVFSKGGAQAPQAPVIAGKATAWKIPEEDDFSHFGVDSTDTRCFQLDLPIFSIRMLSQGEAFLHWKILDKVPLVGCKVLYILELKIVCEEQ